MDRLGGSASGSTVHGGAPSRTSILDQYSRVFNGSRRRPPGVWLRISFSRLGSGRNHFARTRSRTRIQNLGQGLAVHEQERGGIGVGKEAPNDAGLLVGAVVAAPVGRPGDTGDRRDGTVDGPQDVADGTSSARLARRSRRPGRGGWRRCLSASGRGGCARGTSAARTPSRR